MTDVTTTLARAWSLRRRDGAVMGFTDHDRDLVFDATIFRAGTGLSASALVQSTGLSVDNTEAVGALSDAGLREADIRAGLYDGAEVTIWQVDWRDPAHRQVLFRGTLGEITREGGAFRAELRGLSDPLTRAQGRVYGSMCPAVLGDAQCRFDIQSPGFAAVARVQRTPDAQTIDLPPLPEFPAHWFDEGQVSVLDGPRAGLTASIRRDNQHAGGLRLHLWQGPVPSIAEGDLVRIHAGCDKRAATCRAKFANIANFRGFPHVPGDDWLVATPRPADGQGAANA
ncbi:MAG: DUF2163 domain-containing protein [Paracoccaceae bacterium]